MNRNSRDEASGTRRRGWWRVGGCSVAVVLTATSVGFTSPSTALAAGNSESATVLLNSVQGTWTGLDPATNTQAESDIAQMDAIFGDLFEFGTNGHVTDDLAKGYQLLDGAKVFRIFLRKGIKFSDGTPFNAAAVAFNIKRDLDPKNACFCVVSFPVSSVTTPGPYTVDLNLSKPYATLIDSFYGTAPNYIASPTALQKMGEKAFSLNPVGAGPFKVAKDVPNTSLALTKNTGYWKPGQPTLQNLMFTTIGSDESAYDAILAGNAQAYLGLSTPTLISTAAKTLRVTHVPPLVSTDFVQLDTKVPPFNKILAREAIYYATDAAAINKSVLKGSANVTESPTSPGGDYYEPKIPGYRTYNLAKAKQIVSQLGGLKITLLSNQTEVNEEIIEALKSEWAQAGITATLSFASHADVTQDFMTGNWQAAMQSLPPLSPALPLALPGRFMSTSTSSGVKDPKLDQLINTAIATIDPSAQTKKFHQIFKYLNRKAYAAFLFTPPGINITAKSLTGPGLTTGNYAEVLWAQVK